ncbi:hypothetical protein [Spirosoma panaciterrae]|uniref:hypothetical protein n=1 Tax=Spirosoma panaciterrae TaxID=496058 RepID=UPI00036D2FF8|nr:hypothetical protein [Spirosoma panaciterrae]
MKRKRLLSLSIGLASKIRLSIVLVALMVWQGCTKSGDGVTPGKDLTDSKEISKVMVFPDATRETGTPPAETKTSTTPVITNTTPEITGVSGLEMGLTMKYSNAVGNINYIYVQVNGASDYFKIPVKSTSGTSGVITVPFKIPDNVNIPSCSGSQLTIWATTYNGACKRIDNTTCFTSKVPPARGQGNASIGGKNYNTTAVCDIKLPGYGTGYGILINDTQMIVLFNLKQGYTSLVDLVNGNYDPSSGVPWAGYLNETDLYFSTSGTVSYNGKVISVSASLESFEGKRLKITASGNCQ